jgi:hypothetical protein
VSQSRCGTHSIGRWEPPPDEIPDCPNINWIKLGEHFEKPQRPRVQPLLRQSDEGGGALSTEQ